MDERTSDASHVSSSCADFAQRVVARDVTCVMTHTSYVQACHVIPHSKGHEVRSKYLWNHSESSFQAQYIINLASHRREVLDPPLESINDTCFGFWSTLDQCARNRWRSGKTHGKLYPSLFVERFIESWFSMSAGCVCHWYIFIP
jgi:hypothetical protein